MCLQTLAIQVSVVCCGVWFNGHCTPETNYTNYVIFNFSYIFNTIDTSINPFVNCYWPLFHHRSELCYTLICFPPGAKLLWLITHIQHGKECFVFEYYFETLLLTIMLNKNDKYRNDFALGTMLNVTHEHITTDLI